MPTMTLAVPAELKKRMEALPEINWSAVARRAFEREVHDLEVLRRFTAESTLTEEDALRLGRELNRKVAQRYLKKFRLSKNVE